MSADHPPLVSISARTFLAALRAIHEKAPSGRVRVSTFSALSGRVRKSVMVDLATLGLIGEEGSPTEELGRLAHAVDGPDWDGAISSFIERRYPLNTAGGLDRRVFGKLRGGAAANFQPTVGFVSGLLETLGSSQFGAGTEASPAAGRPDAAIEPTDGERSVTASERPSGEGSTKPLPTKAATTRPLIQVADGMVQLDGATLASLSEDELQKLAGLLKTFGRLASGQEPTDGA